MRRLLLIPLVLLALLAASVVWSGGGTERRADFAYINRGDIFTLDLNPMSYMQDFRLTYAIREGLYSPDPYTFRPTPTGATGYDLSDDKRVWTFHLRPQCKWSNGDPVRAADYVFSWRRLLEDPGEYTYLFYYVKNAENYEKSYAKGEPIPWSDVGIEAVNDLTLRVTLKDPVPYLLELLAFPPALMPAFPQGDAQQVEIGGRLVDLFTAIGRQVGLGSCASLACLVLPAGMTHDGLPVGVEFDALPGTDRQLLAVGLSLEQALGQIPPPRLAA